MLWYQQSAFYIRIKWGGKVCKDPFCRKSTKTIPFLNLSPSSLPFSRKYPAATKWHYFYFGLQKQWFQLSVFQYKKGIKKRNVGPMKHFAGLRKQCRTWTSALLTYFLSRRNWHPFNFRFQMSWFQTRVCRKKTKTRPNLDPSFLYHFT